MEKYDTVEKIGEGGHGVVYKIRRTSDDVEFALKESCNKISATMLSEIVFLNYFHEHSVQLHEVIIDDKSINLVLDLWDGDLHHWDHESEEEVIQLFHWLGKVVSCFHSRRFILNDLKPSNILYRKRDGKIEFCLCDMGLCYNEIYMLSHGSLRGTYDWMSRDILTAHRLEERPSFDQAASGDWWAMGLTILAMFDENKSVFDIKNYYSATSSCSSYEDESFGTIYQSMMEEIGSFNLEEKLTVIQDEELKESLRNILVLGYRERLTNCRKMFHTEYSIEESTSYQWDLNFKLFQFSIDFFEKHYYENYCSTSNPNKRKLFIFLTIYASWLTHLRGVKYMVSIHFILMLLYGKPFDDEDDDNHRTIDEYFIDYIYCDEPKYLYRNIYYESYELKNLMVGSTLLQHYYAFERAIQDKDPAQFMFDTFFPFQRLEYSKEQIHSKTKLVSEVIPSYYEAWKYVQFEKETYISDYEAAICNGLLASYNPLLGCKLYRMKEKNKRFMFFILKYMNGHQIENLSSFNISYVDNHKHELK